MTLAGPQSSDATTKVATLQPRWLTVKAASTYCGLGETSVRRFLSGGKLQAHRPCRGRVLIDRFALDSLIQGSTARLRVGRGLNRH